MYSNAGSSVIAASTDTAGISIPPIPIERMKGSGRMIMLSSPTATVEPDTITDAARVLHRLLDRRVAVGAVP